MCYFILLKVKFCRLSPDLPVNKKPSLHKLIVLRRFSVEYRGVEPLTFRLPV